ncbi:MAG: DUF1499 domain-containing protein [Parvularculaceae bacterium]|nr:DUF1499 domain-containing protein [Parvularculaceae bacterium]
MIGRIAGIFGTLALACALAIGLAGPGTRLGVWDWSVGLKLIRWAASPETIPGVPVPPLLLAAGLALLSGLAAFATKRARAGGFALLAALLAGGAMMVPLKMRAAVAANPFIHEVTTDFDDPPAIIAGAALPRKNPADYRGADPVPQSKEGLTVAEAQKKAFPDIAPILTGDDLEASRARAKAVVAAMKMDVLAEGPDGGQSGAGWRIEAVSTSAWFGFKDDFVVRLTPHEEGGTRIDLRSKSRVGGSDLGANAARVRDFTARFNATAG